MKILMVCLGNICRSPLAEGILRYKFQENNITHVEVDSAGTADYHVGQAPDDRTQTNALTHNINLSKLRGRQFTVSDFDLFDQIYVMDASNYANVLLLARTKEDEQKVELLLNKLNAGSNAAVPDPYFGGAQGFENVFQLIDKACDKIVREVMASGQ